MEWRFFSDCLLLIMATAATGGMAGVSRR